MTWETPSFVEIKMSAEIGGYQDDFDERTPVPAEPLDRASDQATAAKD
jgi:hypothetical protein